MRGLRQKISGCEILTISKCGGFHISYGMLKPKSEGYRDPSVWWFLNEFPSSKKDKVKTLKMYLWIRLKILKSW